VRGCAVADPITITVLGEPAPQGSKRHVGNGRMIESSGGVKPWRQAVVWAAREAGQRVAGAIQVEITFTLRRPPSAPKSRLFPDRKPDLSKLIRSTEDALVDAGTIDDDARIVRLAVVKVFPGTDKFALDVPGAIIRISEAR